MNDRIDDISFTQIVEVSNNHQRSYYLPADSNLQSGLAPNDRDHVASSSRADNVEIVHFDTNDTGTMYNTAKEAPTRPVDVITRKLKKKNIKIVTTNIVKILRNAGKKYVSNLKIYLIIARNITEIKPRYQYKKINSNSKPKMDFNFDVNGSKERVCKSLFKNSLDITDGCIRTVVEKKNTSTGVLEGEKRGLHGNQRKVPAEMIEVKKHINSIPRIEVTTCASKLPENS